MNRIILSALGLIAPSILGSYAKPAKKRFIGQSRESKDEAILKAEMKRQRRNQKRLKDFKLV